jgi:hypothetical protein
MEQDTTPNLLFVVSLNDDGASHDGDKGIFSRTMSPEVKSFSPTVLRDSLGQALEGLQDIFSIARQSDSPLPLKSVEVSFEITTSGKVALLGTGAEVGASGAITIIFGE